MSTSPSLIIRIGTRASPLALVQAQSVATHLRSHLPNHRIETVHFTTKGDKLTQQKLIDSGGKGLFTGEIDAAVAQGAVDLAVHSLKDMPSILPAHQEILAIPDRADPREGFISSVATSVETLPDGAILGTASIRREAQARAMRPDLKIVPFRGNVGTRLSKLEAGLADATFLAMAGLSRLGQSDLAHPIALADMCPAPCQGLIAVCGIRARLDPDVLKVLAIYEDDAARIAATIERAFLAGLDGSCRTPIAAHAHIDGTTGQFKGEVYGANPTDIWTTKASFDPRADFANLQAFGLTHAHLIKEKAGGDLPQFQATSW